jgi:sugar fermentation stimulation protein A
VGRVGVTFDPPLEEGTLVRRYKRFLADVRRDDGTVVTMHCPNTGAMLGLTDPGSRVWFSTLDGTSRKYRHTLEIVATAAGDLVGIHSARANALVAEALATRSIVDVSATRIEREVSVAGGRRIDFRLETGDAGPPHYVEVKSVTLAIDGSTGAFPDAPSARARSHVATLVALREAGLRATLLFCVQHTGIERVRAAHEIDPAYATALRAARTAGVDVLAYRTCITPEAMTISTRVPVEC